MNTVHILQNPAKLKPGDRVTLSEKALRQGLQGRKNRRTGVITGITRDQNIFRVLRDGMSVVESWHQDFLKRRGRSIMRNG